MFLPSLSTINPSPQAVPGRPNRPTWFRPPMVNSKLASPLHLPWAKMGLLQIWKPWNVKGKRNPEKMGLDSVRKSVRRHFFQFDIGMWFIDLLFLIVYGKCFIISKSICLVDDLHIECLGCTVPFSGGCEESSHFQGGAQDTNQSHLKMKRRITFFNRHLTNLALVNDRLDFKEGPFMSPTLLSSYKYLYYIYLSWKRTTKNVPWKSIPVGRSRIPYLKDSRNSGDIR